ncbi:hypothetical protein RBB50_007512 [Rhinocladiella similis]
MTRIQQSRVRVPKHRTPTHDTDGTDERTPRQRNRTNDAPIHPSNYSPSTSVRTERSGRNADQRPVREEVQSADAQGVRQHNPGAPSRRHRSRDRNGRRELFDGAAERSSTSSLHHRDSSVHSSSRRTGNRTDSSEDNRSVARRHVNHSNHSHSPISHDGRGSNQSLVVSHMVREGGHRYPETLLFEDEQGFSDRDYHLSDHHHRHRRDRESSQDRRERRGPY